LIYKIGKILYPSTRIKKNWFNSRKKSLTFLNAYRAKIVKIIESKYSSLNDNFSFYTNEPKQAESLKK
jgi:hypothetical protein